MASSIINSIRSALDDVLLLDKEIDVFLLKFSLKNLETFVVCARKFVNDGQLRFDDNDSSMDGDLESLLVRIGHAVCRYAGEISPYCRALESGVDPLEIKEDPEVGENISHFAIDMMSFDKEISKWYITLSDTVHLRQSGYPTIDEVTEIVDSVLANIWYFHAYTYYREVTKDAIEAMGDKIKLLRNFIRFVALLRVENQHLEKFLIHVEAVALNAAHLTLQPYFMAGLFHEELRKKIQQPILVLLQKIKPIDSQVNETYTAVLAGSKLSTESHSWTPGLDCDPVIIMKDFIDFLLWNLSETPQMDACPVNSTKDQLQLLHKGLMFMRSILEQQPNKFNAGVIDLSRVVICDAGVIIFSLYQKDVAMDHGLPDLLERFKTLWVEVEEQGPETSIFNFPKTNVLGFLDFLLGKLLEVKSCKLDSDTQSRIETIEEDLAFLRSFLEELAELKDHQEGLQARWNLAVEVAYRIEFLIDQLVLGDIGDSFSKSFHSVKEDIMIIKTDALKIFQGRREEIKEMKVTWTSTQIPSESIAPATDEFVGFEDETASIINRLIRGSKKLQVVAIVGMPGLGKTTLATKIYNDLLVMRHFHVRSRCSVSQSFNQRKLLLELLNGILKDPPERYFTMTEHELSQELWRSLKRRRYLIFLDDVWDIEAFDSLKESFPDDSNESRILLTSRHRDVAPQSMLDEEPHFLRQLTNDESWELLQKKSFPKIDCLLALSEIGKQIAERCKGLPLTVVVVAGLLTTLEVEGWKEVLKSLSSGIISSTEQCMNTLELSYKHLPEYLKPCLLYLGMFPEDQEVPIERLIWLWMAEGFVRKNGQKSLEDVASNYVMDLVGRSLVIVARKGSMGGVKAIRVHDLLHDFCRTKAKEENFFQLLKGYDELVSFTEPGQLRRLCIHSENKHFKYLRLFRARVRSLLFFTHGMPGAREYDISFIFPVFKHLSVLNIGEIVLGCAFPSEMELLVQLKYLAVKGGMEEIPASIGNLWNLETFIVDSSYTIALPDTFWNLHKLRHLSMRRGLSFPLRILTTMLIYLSWRAVLVQLFLTRTSVKS